MRTLVAPTARDTPPRPPVANRGYSAPNNLGTTPEDAAGVDLAAAYPWPEPGTPWLRAMMLVTLDGAFVGPDGHSRSISSGPDREVMAEVRRLADAVLVGAGTMRAERYGPLRADPDAVEERRTLGLADAPRIVLVSGSLDLPWEEPMFTGGSAVRPLVVTTSSAPADALGTAREHADVEVLDGGTVGPAPLVAALHRHGLHRVVCEGGPRLLAGLMAADVVDEADVTLAPLYVGGGQIVTGDVFARSLRLRLVGVLESDGYLFNRYCA